MSTNSQNSTNSFDSWAAIITLWIAIFLWLLLTFNRPGRLTYSIILTLFCLGVVFFRHMEMMRREDRNNRLLLLSAWSLFSGLVALLFQLLQAGVF